MNELTFAQRLRISSAFGEIVTLQIDRETAHHLIRMLEREERIIQAEGAFHALLANRNALEQIRDNTLDAAIRACFWLSMCAIWFGWLISVAIR